MAMKKTSGGDSPLWQGAEKSFWTLLIFGLTTVVDHDVFWKSDQVLRFFLSGGLYRRRAIVRGGQGLGHATLVCGALVAPLQLLFRSLEASEKNKTTGTCFIQF
jgi:hypothetical protein